VASEFTQQVAAKLSELTAENPSVSEQGIADAMLAESDKGSIDSEQLREALNELQAASVAVLLGQNSEQGRIWRHSGMTEEDAQRLLAEQADADELPEDFEEQAAARAAEIEEAEREREQDAGEPEDDPALAELRRRDGRRAMPPGDGSPQRVELPMAVAGALDEDAIGKLVTAGLAAAESAGVGFEFVVTR
jgi:hypothetical protein